MAKSLLIAFEGIDGAGTTTQVQHVADRLRAQGRKVHTTAEPSDRHLGREIRCALQQKRTWTPETLALAFAADRLDHYHFEIAPRLADGYHVLTDRYLLSSLAYQSLDAPLEWVAEINRYAPRPDASILLRIDPNEGESRRAQRGSDTELFDAIDKQNKISRTYDELMERTDLGPIYAVDGEQSIADVTGQISAIITELEGLGD